MKSVRPELDAPIVTFAEHQHEFRPIEAALVVDPSFEAGARRIGPQHFVGMNTVLYAFEPYPDQIKRLVAGQPIYIGLLTGARGSPQPILVLVGKEEAGQVYNVMPTGS
jgi:hypothetical protein